MKFFVLTLAALVTFASALSNKYLPPLQSSSARGSFAGSFSSASTGHGTVTQPSRQYLAPAGSSFNGVSGGHSADFSSGSLYNGLGTNSKSHGAIGGPSRQYLAPSAFLSRGISTGFKSGATSFGNFGHDQISRQYMAPAVPSSYGVSSSSSRFSTFPSSSRSSFNSFNAGNIGHATAAHPSRQYLAPPASFSHDTSSFGGHSSGFSSRDSSFNGFGATHAATSSHSGTKYGSNGGYEYHRHRF